MTTPHQTYEAAVIAASAARVVTRAAADYAGANAVAAANLAYRTGSYTTFAAAIKAADAARIAAYDAAEQSYSKTVGAALQGMHLAGDLTPA